MTDPEKMAWDCVSSWPQGNPLDRAGERRLARLIASALRAARNEGRDEREREIFGDEPLMMAESLDTLADVLVGAAHPTAKVFRELAAAIRFKKDSGNG